MCKVQSSTQWANENKETSWIVIDRKRFQPSIRPKIIGRIFGRNEYSESAAENEKSFV
jgi:hypothetical protein